MKEQGRGYYIDVRVYKNDYIQLRELCKFESNKKEKRSLNRATLNVGSFRI